MSVDTLIAQMESMHIHIQMKVLDTLWPLFLLAFRTDWIVLNEKIVCQFLLKYSLIYMHFLTCSLSLYSYCLVESTICHCTDLTWWGSSSLEARTSETGVYIFCDFPDILISNIMLIENQPASHLLTTLHHPSSFTVLYCNNITL